MAKQIIIVTGEFIVEVQRDINKWLVEGWRLKDALIVTHSRYHDLIRYTQVLEKD